MSETKEVAGLVERLNRWAIWLDSDICSDEPAGDDCREAAREIERLTAERDAVDAQMVAQNRILSQVWDILDSSKGENLIERVSTLTRQLEEARATEPAWLDDEQLSDELHAELKRQGAFSGKPVALATYPFGKIVWAAAIRSLKAGNT